MNESDIIGNIAARLGISELNAMQLAVKSSKARRSILLAPTGSGKTVAFAIALLRSLSSSRGFVQGVVLSPSRELVVQTSDVIRRIADGLKTVPLYGGHPMQDEVNSLSPVPDIIVATPGRLLDHIRRRTVDLSSVRSMVIDEYDKLLELGFAEEMRHIAKAIRREGFTMLTSATELTALPDFIDLDGAETINCTDDGSPYNARPRFNIAKVESPARDKAGILAELLRSLPDGKILVFVNHRESAERLYTILAGTGFPVGLYHGGLEQREREMAVAMLENGSCPILIATDLGSRGLDIHGLDAVIHYHMPVSPEAWTHRNGRTARAGATGDVFIIVSEADNIPEYVKWDHDYVPTGHSDDPITARFSTLHFNIGKKEKISRGDIVGFLCKKGGLEAAEIGKINIADHWTLVAVPHDKAEHIVEAVAKEKIKGQRARITRVNL